MDSPESQTPICLSCGAPLFGQYCSQCGDERFTQDKRTVRYFFANTLVSELFNLDSRIWRSLRLLMSRAGFLAVEYALGRRRPYVNALRLLIITIVVFALTMNGRNFTLSFPLGDFVINLNTIPSPMFADSSMEGALQRTDPYGVVEDMLETKLGVPLAEISEDEANAFKSTLISLATPLSFTVVLLLGLLLYLLFNRRRPMFVDHLVFAMHYYSFLLITAMLSSLVFSLADGHLSLAGVLIILFSFGLWRLAYVTIGIRRFYLPEVRAAIAWPAAVGAGLLFQLFNAVSITSIQLACGAVAVWLL